MLTLTQVMLDLSERLDAASVAARLQPVALAALSEVQRTLTSLVAGLLSTLPYKDRAVSKLLAAAPQLPACVLVTLDDLCHARVDSLPPPPPVRLDLTRSRESPLGAERASVCKPPLATQKGCWINTDMSVK